MKKNNNNLIGLNRITLLKFKKNINNVLYYYKHNFYNNFSLRFTYYTFHLLAYNLVIKLFRNSQCVYFLVYSWCKIVKYYYWQRWRGSFNSQRVVLRFHLAIYHAVYIDIVYYANIYSKHNSPINLIFFLLPCWFIYIHILSHRLFSFFVLGFSLYKKKTQGCGWHIYDWMAMLHIILAA